MLAASVMSQAKLTELLVYTCKDCSNHFAESELMDHIKKSSHFAGFKRRTVPIEG